MKTQQRLTTSRTLENGPRRKRERHEEGARHSTRWGGGRDPSRVGKIRNPPPHHRQTDPARGKKRARGSGSGQDGSALIVGTPKMGVPDRERGAGFRVELCPESDRPAPPRPAQTDKRERGTRRRPAPIGSLGAPAGEGRKGRELSRGREARPRRREKRGGGLTSAAPAKCELRWREGGRDDGRGAVAAAAIRGTAKTAISRVYAIDASDGERERERLGRESAESGSLSSSAQVYLLVLSSNLWCSFLFSMSESSSYRGQMGRRSDGVSLHGDDMNISSDDEELVDSPSLRDLGEPFLMDFCRKASTAFFHEYVSGEKLAECGKVYTQKLVRSDIQNWERTICGERAEKGDSDFGLGGYFLVKGAEKTFIAQEQISLKKLWIPDNQGWTIAYRSSWKRKSLYIKLAGNCDVEYIRGEEKVLTAYFLLTEIPLWILLFALGVSSDKEVVELIDFGHDDSRVVNILFASIHEADEKYDGFRKGGKAFSE
ncbi:hypothetical protein NL676_001103 [Syzygium grande]|nr:hypothetical protein NL676_001103 [Syzygium grande]